MDYEMERLILVPQYPSHLRYQEWWWDRLPEWFSNYYDEVLVLGAQIPLPAPMRNSSEQFSSLNESIELEAEQIYEYSNLGLRDNDTLLLCDLSYPGLFTNILLHKRPKKCFAICHATSLNRFDYFAKVRKIKYPIEKHQAKLFDAIFVGSYYHKEKLKDKGWDNVEVTYMPFPPFTGKNLPKEYNITSVARKGKQKRNAHLEKVVSTAFNCEIYNPQPKTWDEYYDALAKSKVLLITSNEETFGYQVIDAIKNRCIPIAPNAFSYPELISKEFLYNNTQELFDKIDKALRGELSIPKILPPDSFMRTITLMMQHIYI